MMFGEDNDSRIIYLSADIDNLTTAEVCKQILHYIERDIDNYNKYKQYEIRPIQLYIQSFGGSIYDMFSLIDIIESSPIPIYTYCCGYCMSAAALIFMAGHKRYMMKHSVIMLHQISYNLDGTYADNNITIDEMKRMHNKIKKFIKKHCDLPKKKMDKIFSRKEDLYLSYKKCYKYNICDYYIESGKLLSE